MMNKEYNGYVIHKLAKHKNLDLYKLKIYQI